MPTRQDDNEARADVAESRADESELRADESAAQAGYARTRADASETRADVAEARADVAEDRLDSLRREVGELKSGTSGLAEQVATLSLALQTVGQLQARQASVEKTAHTAKSVADRTARAVVPRDELERREKAARARVLGNLYLVSGLSITMLLLLLLGGINYLQGRNGDLYQVCVTRNATNQVVLDVLTQRDPNPAFPAPDAFQVKQTNRLKKAFAVNDCGKLR